MQEIATKHLVPSNGTPTPRRIPAVFYEHAKTCGVYGLRDPDTQVVRYVGESEHIEKRYSLHIGEKSDFKITSAMRYKPEWIRDLRSRGLLPELVVLTAMPDSSREERQAEEKRWIGNLELIGGADLNLRGSTLYSKGKWRKFVGEPC